MTAGHQPSTSARRNLRLDIEGLRAVAIGLVLIFHAGLPLTGGFIGVDVFFVLSGFLITGILIRELENTGSISLARFYARRAKRLLPATGVVLITTAVLTWLTISSIDWRTFGWDIVAAATYVVNWVLAERSVDYLAEDVGASPVQHFWSLAVEEQFYIVWPLLLIAVAWWYRRSGGTRLRGRMLAGILLIALPSFVWSVIYTASHAEQAFFVTPTRLWEMAIGAFVAIGARHWPRLPRVASEILGWAGLLTIFAAAIFIKSSTPWPSYWALLPTLGSAAVIIAGFTPATSCSRLLSIRPAVWVGGISYSWYLWHWPLLIAADAHWGGLTMLQGLVVALVSGIPAYLSYRFIENPIRFAPSLSKSNSLALSVGANFSFVGVVAGLVLILAVGGSGAPNRASANSEQVEAQVVGAAALANAATAQGDAAPGTLESLEDIEWFTPQAADAASDLADYEKECQVDQQSSDLHPCEYGDLDGPLTVAVVGDSKVLQYLPAFEEAGSEHGIHFIFNTKSACTFSTGVQKNKGKVYSSCTDWNTQLAAYLEDLEPDAVVTSSRIDKALSDPTDPESADRETMGRAITEAWQRLEKAGIPVIGILDNPTPDLSVYECVAEADDLSECVFDKGEGIERSSAELFQDAHREVPTSYLIDIRDQICPDDVCVPVIGNVLVYRQTSHITDTYSRTLAPTLERELIRAIDAVRGE